MRKIIFILVSLLFTTCAFATSLEPQKFKVIYTITYNSRTLQEASEIEVYIRKNFPNTCSINVKVEEKENLLDEDLTAYTTLMDNTN